MLYILKAFIGFFEASRLNYKHLSNALHFEGFHQENQAQNAQIFYDSVVHQYHGEHLKWPWKSAVI